MDATSPFRDDLLAGKRILVTGGGTGIGRHLAGCFHRLGAELHLCGRRPEVLARAREEMRAAAPDRPEVFAHPCDVRDRDQVEATLDAVWAQGPLDVLVNNAAGNFLSRTEDLSARAVEAVVGIVLLGTANVTLACGRRWLARGHRAVVLSISTTYAPTGSAYVVPSAMAKAGVDAMTRSLAVEWGPRGIRFHGIAPGPFQTEGAFSRLVPAEKVARLLRERHPLKRFGHLDEIADLAAFLVSDRGEYLNGEIVTLDGGERLAGAGQFNALVGQISEEEWAAFKPKKAPPAAPTT